MNEAILGFGAMRLPLTDENDPATIDMEEFTKMIDYYMEQGFDFFDTSYAYHNQTSENALKKALVERYPRESYRICDKIPTWALTGESDNDKFVHTMLERLGIDYFDVLLIHNINQPFLALAENAKSFEYVKKLKENGTARKIGISFHDKAELLEKVLEKYSDCIDIILIQLNYLDWHDKTIQSKKIHDLCVQYGIEIMVMEPIKGGTLVNVAESVKEQFKEYSDRPISDWALRFAASQENVSIVLSGMASLEQMKENCRTFKEFEKITKDDHRFLMKMAREIKKTVAVDCSYCGYCIKECEANIPIPDFFKIYNDETLYSLPSNYANYGTLSAATAPASACTQCGTCIEYCTQQLDIPEILMKVSEQFESG